MTTNTTNNSTNQELTDFTLTRSVTPRNARQLPTLHYIVADDWIDKLGEKSFCLYLKLWTMVDRTEEFHKIKQSQSRLATRLKISKPTLLKQLAPLYEYGLIELQEYEESKQTGNKPINIVVHRHPQNNPDLAIQPLEKVRDWSKRTEIKYEFTKKGGKPTHKTEPQGSKKVEPQEPQEPTNAPDNEPVQEPITMVPSELQQYFTSEILEKLQHNQVDIGVLFKWVEENKDNVSERDINLVISELCNYLEPVKSTAGAIGYIMANADKIRKKLIAIELSKIAEQIPTDVSQNNISAPKVPFYNWLEERE